MSDRSAEAHFFRVGLFAFLGLLVAVGSVVAIGGRSLFQDTIVVETYFSEPVGGLGVGAPVKAMGVTIGSVTEIGFVYQYYRFETPRERIEKGGDILVRMEIVRTGDLGLAHPTHLLVEEGLRIHLEQQGITGVTFLEADIRGDDAPPVPTLAWEPKYPWIPSEPSLMSTLTGTAKRVFERIDQVEVEEIAGHVDELVLAATKLVRDVDAKIEDVDVGRAQGEVLSLLGELRATVREVRGAVEGFSRDEPEMAAAAVAALDRAATTFARIDRVVAASEYDLAAGIENVRVVSDDLRAITETLRRQPSLILRSDAPTVREPTEASR